MNSNGIRYETTGAGFKEIAKRECPTKGQKTMRKKGEWSKLAAVNAYNLDYLREKFS